MAAPEKRTELVAFRMSPEEVAMLRELADADGIAQSGALRLLVRRAHAERFGGSPKARKTKRKR